MTYCLKKQMSLFMASAFFIAIMPVMGPAQDGHGKLNGFVYGNDGKKPLAEAVVLLRETVSQRVYRSEKTKKNGAYKIPNIVPGTYTVGIQHQGKDFNVDVFLEVNPKKQMACFTLPKLEEKPGYQIRCKSPKCFFITPVGWALVAGATAGIIFGVVKIQEQQTSPTGI
jgi:hypothetical protein